MKYSFAVAALPIFFAAMVQNASAATVVSRNDMPAAQNAARVHLSNLMPDAGSVQADRQPAIGANFSVAVDPDTVKVFLDGSDISKQATVISSAMVYQPRTALPGTVHHVAVAGLADDGTRFYREWSFTTGTVHLHDGVSVGGVHNGDVVGRHFTVNGRSVPHARVQFRIGDQDAGETKAGNDGFYSRRLAAANVAPGKPFTLHVAAIEPGGSAVFTNALQLQQAH